MCGISFIYSKNLDKQKLIKLMINELSHRGPDFKNHIIFNHAAIAHSRLSIIDINERSNQPFFDNSRRYVISFNGEIYNYNYLKKQLTDYDFKTESDTEVLLASYLKWKEKCLEKLNGMFAFVIYDTLNNSFFAARDRLGIKPLYYYIDENKDFLLASEIKSLLKTNIRIRPNENYFIDYIQTERRLYENETCFNNIFPLTPGSYINGKNNNFEFKKYYKLIEKIKVNYSDNIEDTTQFIEKQIDSSTDYRIQSDVPISLNFSGGLDSTLLLKSLSEKKNLNLKINTLFSNEISSGEIEYCNKIIERLNFLKNSEKIFIENFFTHKEFKLENVMKSLEAPFNRSHLIDRFLAYNSRQQGRIVILDGQGGDETFLGYYSYVLSYIVDCITNLKFQNIFKIIGLNPINSFKELFLDIGKSVFFRLLNKKEKIDYVRKYLGWKLDEIIISNYAYKVNYLLAIRDKNSMAFGTELRVPFLDHNLVEQLSKISVHKKFREGKRKAIILKYFADKGLDELTFRKKNTFIKINQSKALIKFYDSQLSKYSSIFSGLSKQLIKDYKLDINNKTNNHRLSQLELWQSTFM